MHEECRGLLPPPAPTATPIKFVEVDPGSRYMTIQEAILTIRDQAMTIFDPDCEDDRELLKQFQDQLALIYNSLSPDNDYDLDIG